MSSVSTLLEAMSALNGSSTIFQTQTSQLLEIKEVLESAINMAKEVDGVLAVEVNVNANTTEYLEGYVGRQAEDEADTGPAEEALSKTREAFEHISSTGASIEGLVNGISAAIGQLNEIYQALGYAYNTNNEASELIGALTNR